MNREELASSADGGGNITQAEYDQIAAYVGIKAGGEKFLADVRRRTAGRPKTKRLRTDPTMQPLANSPAASRPRAAEPARVHVDTARLANAFAKLAASRPSAHQAPARAER